MDSTSHQAEKKGTTLFIRFRKTDADLLLKKTKYGQKHLPDWMAERGPRSLVEHQQRMAFDNGSQITSMPSASDPARGESASLIVVDEWAFLPNPEDAWASIEPVADIGGRIIGLSTANGSGNFYHQLWVGATAGTNKFAPMFFPWSATEDRGDAWYQDKRESMLPWQLAQEYPSTPEEAFVKSGNPVFDLDVLDQLESQVCYGEKGDMWRYENVVEFRAA